MEQIRDTATKLKNDARAPHSVEAENLLIFKQDFVWINLWKE